MLVLDVIDTEARISRLFGPAPKVRAADPGRVSIADIRAEVCAELGVSMLDLKSGRQDRRTVSARHMVIALARDITHLSLGQIGRFVSRDHTTIMNSLSRAGQRTLADPEWAATKTRIARRLTE
jgi:chromosomal replication initiator protein